MNKGYYIYRIHSKVDAMSKFIDLEKLINGEKNSLAQIRNYFKVSHWAYKLFHSQDGFMHFRISKSGAFTDEDIYHQPDAIADYIKAGVACIFGPGTPIPYSAIQMMKILLDKE